MKPAPTALLLALAFAAGWCARSLRRVAVAPGEPSAPASAPLPPSVPGAARPGADDDVEPAARRSGCRLSGDLCDDEERVLAGLALELRPCPAARPEAAWSSALAALSGEAIFAATTCDEKGAFAVEGVPAGGWALFVRGEGDLPRAAYCFRLTPDQRAVHKSLVLPRGWALRGSVLDPEGRPCPGAEVRATGLDAAFQANARSGSDGRFVLGPLLAGLYRLEASAAETLTVASRVVRAGEDPLELRLAPGALLCVRARDESGAPVVVRLELHGPSERSESGATFRLTRLTPGPYELVARTDDGRTAMLGGLTLEAGLAPVPLELVLASPLPGNAAMR